MKKILFYTLIVSLLPSCATRQTAAFSEASENAWFLQVNPITNDISPVYCMARVSDNHKKASPICYDTKYGEEKGAIRSFDKKDIEVKKQDKSNWKSGRGY